jgi:hypothetical protein
MWCEQQLHYGFARPEETRPDAPAVARGSELHLAREMETQEYVDVDVASPEDVFALKMLNLVKCLDDFRCGNG